jgi:hypothetical protein
LDLAGLGLACLELHSNKTTRKRVIDELRRTLDAPRPARSTATAGLAELLAGDRARLNEHAVAMNDPVEPMEMAPYEAVGKLLAVDARRSGGSWPRLALDRASSWNAVERQRRLDLVRELQRSCSMLGGTVSSHPLWGARKTRFLPSDQERIKSQIEALRQPVEGWIAEASKLAQSMGVSPPKSPAEAATREWQARAIASARARPSLDPGLAEWEDSALDDLLRAGAQWALLREKHDAVLLPEAWDSDVLETRQVWNTTGRKFWRFFSPSYWKARGRIARLCRSKPPRTHGERLALLDAILEGNRLRQSIKDSDSLGSQLFGTLWQGETSDWSGLRGVAKTIRTLRGLVAEGALPAASLAAADPASARALEEQANRSESAGATAKSRLSESLDQLEFAPTEREKVLALPFDELRARLGGFSDRLVDLPILGNWNQLATRLAELGLEAVATLASDWPDAVNHLDDLVEGGIAERCLAVATETRPSLQSFEGATHEQRIDLFARRDAEQFETTRARLASQHFDSLPRQVAAIGQLGVLRREMEKKARHLPVRQLMAKAGQAVRAVKPVFLMSPLSVAAYLPPGGARFDLVVFDEASQVRPVEAFGAIARGNQVVVVGDKQQMPPTTFFDRMIDEETADFDDEDEPSPESGTTSAPGGARELESILGLFDAAGAPSRMLRWHYRSRHDSLIAVSNAEFYQNRLVVFPSPRLDRGHYGLSLRLLPETHYDRGGSRTNPGEADAVCQAVMDFARDQMAKPESERETLGVAAFSIPQAQAILDRLEGLRRDRLELEPFFAPGGAEPFFVKNLENVQGDERDAVFISVGYGRTKEGTLSLNFGPLNASGGQRRLNVLISRAKKRCIVFSNIRGADLDLSRTSAEGVKALKAFLTYAEGGSLGDSAPSGVAAATDSVLERVEADLVDAGYRAEPSFGSSSERVGLAVLDPKDPAAFVMGIHTDGRRYASARSATDRNRLRDLVYDRLGWRTFYAWGLDWLHDGERAKSKLLRAIEEAVASRRNPPPPATTTPAHSPSVTDGPARLSGTNAEQTARSPKPKVAARQENATSAQQTEYQSATAAVGAITPYVLAKPRIRLGNDELAEVSPEHIASWVKEIVDVEWPVHVAEVKRRILDATATKRLGSRIDAALDAGIAHAARSGMVRKSGEFLTHTDPANSRIRDRSELPATSRKLEMIAPEELSAAVHFVLGQSMGAAIEELPPAVAKLLGLTRAHEELAAAVAASAQRLVETGRLRQQGELLVVVPPVSQPPIA